METRRRPVSASIGSPPRIASGGPGRTQNIQPAAGVMPQVEIVFQGRSEWSLGDGATVSDGGTADGTSQNAQTQAACPCPQEPCAGAQLQQPPSVGDKSLQAGHRWYFAPRDQLCRLRWIYDV